MEKNRRWRDGARAWGFSPSSRDRRARPLGGRAAYAADGADEAGDGDAATGTTHISWSVVDSFSGNTLENAKITITAASNGAETVPDTADLQSSTIALPTATPTP